MKKRLLSLSALALTAVSALAQSLWTPPTPPAAQDLVPGEKVFLYNKDAGGFLRGLGEGKNGGPYWGSRAGVAVEGADTVIFQPAVEASILEGTTPTVSTYFKWDEVWDNQTYILQNYASHISEPRWDEVWFSFNNLTDIWTDRQNNVEANYNFFWNVTKNDNGTYSISVSKKSIGIADPDIYASFFEIDENTGEYIKECPIKGGERLGVSISDLNGEARLEGYTTDLAYEWVIVRPEDYATLDTAALKVAIAAYRASNSLKAYIDAKKADYPTVDFSKAEAVYSNTASTADELLAAKKFVDDAISSWVESQVTFDNPQDMTDDFIVNSTLDSNHDGWTSTTGCQNNAQATNQCDGTHSYGSFWENWNPSAFKGKMHKVLTGMPKGVYTLQLAAFSNAKGGVYAYINGDSVEVTTDAMNTYKVTAYVDVDTIDLGIKQPVAVANWMGIDNVKLVYYGNSAEAQNFYKESILSTIPSADELITDETYYKESYKTAFETEIAKVDVSMSIVEFKEALTTVIPAFNAIKANIAAYESYQAAVKEAEAFLAENGDQLNAEADTVEYLTEYIGGVYAPGEDYPFPNGSYQYIIGEEEPGACTLETEQIPEEIVYVHALVQGAAKETVEGGDVTNLLVNPGFTNKGEGWTLGSGCKPDFQWGVSEVFGDAHGIVDIYQTLTNVKPGIYSISVQAFERPTGNGGYDGTEEPKVFLYMGDLETPVQNITKDVLPAEMAEDRVNCLLSNDYLFTSADGTISGYVPNGMEGASIAFAAGRYYQECYGIVGEDGIMKIGLTSHGVKPHWVLFDDFKLTFWGKNTEAMTEVLTGKYENGLDYLDTYGSEMTQPAYNALNDALVAAEAAVDSEDFDLMSAALSAITKATIAAGENRTAVTELTSALDALDIAMSDYEASASEEALTNAVTIIEKYGGEASEALTTEEVKAATEEVKLAAAALKIPNTVADASDENPVDLTALIVNADFSDAKNGWSETFGGGNSGALGNGYEYWNGSASALSFNINQAIKVIPAGKYILGADLANSYNGQAHGTNGGRAVLYASVVVGTDTTTYSVAVEPQEENADVLKKHEVTFDVPADAVVIVGTKTHGTMDARWFSYDNFTLTYFGTASAKENSGDYTPIEGIEENNVVAPVAIYNLAGSRVNNLTKGINIVKMSDGSVKKVLVK